MHLLSSERASSKSGLATQYCFEEAFFIISISVIIGGKEWEGGYDMAKILIVDDTLFMRTMLKKLLEDNGYQIAGEAGTGEEAIQKYKILQPDLVTMDITMPDMDGISAVKEIMALDLKAKIIMCSAMGQQSLVLDAIKAGAKDFIVKPFQQERVLEAVKRVL
jgi:two-component system, chemotaxis family, chemotaxis protein CheY